jgi:hypothetical protein
MRLMNSRPVALSIPAALLVIASALSCSTACVTYGAAVAISAGAAAASVGGSAAMKELEKHRSDRIGTTAIPAVSPDPAAIEQGLRPAMPSGTAKTQPDPKRLQVVRQPAESGQANVTVYTITACDSFSLEYAQAFATFANQLRTQLPGQNKFIIIFYRNKPTPKNFLTQLEID